MITLDRPLDFLTPSDFRLFADGRYDRAYQKMGAHRIPGQDGVAFAVWAPNAKEISVIGDFNGWKRGVHPMRNSGFSGIWECFVPSIKPGALYKYAITSRFNNYKVEKADPYAFAAEHRPLTASKVWDLSAYTWGDSEWMRDRHAHSHLNAPISIYEVHAGSWRRVPEENNRWLTYREMAPLLARHAHELGFTHIEFMPIAEHPFDGSWGYQTTGYFAPTSRFGTPDDFMFLIDHLHQNGIGVILDWVPGGFPSDEHGLNFFDGTHLYEHADPRQGHHPEWGTMLFNHKRPEVNTFLQSNALFWLDRYHIDGLRVDGVASMLYLDYSRKAGEWVPNEFGGRENLDSVRFLRQLNETVYGNYPDTMTIAEESTSWPMVSRPTYLGGLGFGLKWDMGWMHDTLSYMSRDAIHRVFHHNEITFRMLYAFTENFVMPLSHDEVVYGKGSLINKMPGDTWQKFANLRLLLGYMFMQPGKKMLFMGGEFGQWNEWKHDGSLDWNLLEHPQHQGLKRWVQDLNTTYRGERSLHELDCEPSGFEWLDCSDNINSIVSFLRYPRERDTATLAVFNFTPVVRTNYRLGVPWPGHWQEILNSDASLYGGTSQGNFGGLETYPLPWHGRAQSINLTLPPLGLAVFKGHRP